MLIGVTLGFMGSGGSILTIPVLVYLLGHEENIAVAESMGIVGSISILAAIIAQRPGDIDWRSVFFFGVPGMAGTSVGAWLGANYFSGTAKLLSFSLIMLIASVFMIRNPARPQNDTHRPSDQDDVTRPDRKILSLVAQGIGVGIITGIVGVGGGFMIVPALVILGRLAMRTAVASSLVIIAANGAVGFASYQLEFAKNGLSVDWPTIFWFVALGAPGSIAGRQLSHRLNQATLRKVFAGLLIVMAALILVREVPAL